MIYGVKSFFEIQKNSMNFQFYYYITIIKLEVLVKGSIEDIFEQNPNFR